MLWRIRKAFADFQREYELIVFNDGSTDATAEVLAPYTDALPLTILGGPQHVGYAKALDALFRAALDRCRYPRRDAIILMQGDLTDRPEHIPELVKRFEGGADIVVGEAAIGNDMPKPVRQLQRIGRWLARRFARVPGVNNPLGSFRLFRVTVVRDAVRAAGETPIVEGDGWAANIDLLLAMAPHARRIESVPLQPRYDLRPRSTRVRPWHDAFRLYRFGREARERRPQLRLAGAVVMRMLMGVGLLLGFVASPTASAQTDSVTSTGVTAVAKAVPFGLGERMEYVAKYGPQNIGKGSMEIVGIEDIRGRPAVHTNFRLKGRWFFFSANYVLDSWVDQATFTSVRFAQDNDDDASEKDKVYEIFPDRQMYSVNNGEEQPSVPDPLDEGALLYFVRTMELEVGQTYTLNRYFRPDRNPVIVKVLRRETVKLPAGKYNTIVIQPIIKSKGIFSESGQAQIWLSDDKDRVMVQMRVRLKVATISLQLTKHIPASNAPPNTPP